MPLRSVAFLLYFFGSSTAAFVYPMVGLICYIVLYHVYPQTTWWGKALEFLDIRYAFICGTCLLIGTVLNLNRLKMSRQLIHPVEGGALLVFGAVLLSLVTGYGWATQTPMLLDKMAKVVVFLMLMSRILVTRQRLWIFTVVLTVLTLYLGHEAKNAPPGSFLHNRLDGIGGPDFRESAGLAIHLCAMFPFVAVVLYQKRIWLKLMAFFAICYGVNAVLLCRARSAFLAAVVAGLVAIWYAPRRYRRWVAVVLILGVLGGFALSDTWFWERMDTIVIAQGQERDASAAIRLIIWAAAWEMFKDNVMGVGIGQFDNQVRKYSHELDNRRRDAHNTFVLCAGETGILGLVAYMGTLILSWMTLNHASRQARNRLSDPSLFEWLILANRLALVVYIVAGLFVSRFYTEGMWWLIVLPVCIDRAVANEVRQEVHEELALHNALADWSRELGQEVAVV